MRIGIYLLALALVVVSIGVASAVVPDYLKPSDTKLDQTTAKIGDLVAASMTLEKVGVVPEEAKLNYTTDLTSPRLEIQIDDAPPETYGVQSYQIPLPVDGVRKIEIRISGWAPTVEKMTTITVLSINTYVKYKGDEPEWQDDGTLTLTVTDIEIKQTVTAIDDAWAKYNEARTKIDSLKAKGVATTELEAELQDARTQIDLAESAHENGEIETAKSNAQIATNALNRLLSKADEMGAGPAPTDVKRYLTIAAAVIIVLLLAVIIRGRREELG
ncbi:MAG: hypothetical protein V3T58_00175 [Candidatus Hydrothermarchaeales archaeon]